MFLVAATTQTDVPRGTAKLPAFLVTAAGRGLATFPPACRFAGCRALNDSSGCLELVNALRGHSMAGRLSLGTMDVPYAQDRDELASLR